MADIKAIAEQLVNLTVKEVSELATILKEEYGIEPAAAAVAVAAAPGAAGAAAEEEKTSFDVVLKSAGAAKLQVVKAVKGFYFLLFCYELFVNGLSKLINIHNSYTIVRINNHIYKQVGKIYIISIKSKL